MVIDSIGKHRKRWLAGANSRKMPYNVDALSPRWPERFFADSLSEAQSV